MNGGSILEKIRKIYKDDTKATEALERIINRDKKAEDDTDVINDEVKNLQFKPKIEKSAKDDLGILEIENVKFENSRAKIFEFDRRWIHNNKHRLFEGDMKKFAKDANDKDKQRLYEMYKKDLDKGLYPLKFEVFVKELNVQTQGLRGGGWGVLDENIIRGYIELGLYNSINLSKSEYKKINGSGANKNLQLKRVIPERGRIGGALADTIANTAISYNYLNWGLDKENPLPTVGDLVNANKKDFFNEEKKLPKGVYSEYYINGIAISSGYRIY